MSPGASLKRRGGDLSHMVEYAAQRRDSHPALLWNRRDRDTGRGADREGTHTGAATEEAVSEPRPAARSADTRA
ncbi:hypothetical protein NDU88_005613 [Pleurodeles waltl]|uniref:Uncharacterized protein n=1 Tax=Pleurodeles waltl TaxID=8319 RepID=A0AAV7SM49_PLEWA|nr:hypothetical protein NDU88_005613 [Pleurodeles waltl]